LGKKKLGSKKHRKEQVKKLGERGGPSKRDKGFQTSSKATKNRGKMKKLVDKQLKGRERTRNGKRAER